MDRTIFFLEIDMAKKYVNQNFDKRWVVDNLNNMFKRWVIHNLLKTITFKVEGNPHLTSKTKTKKKNYNDHKNRHRPNGSLFKLS
jgi:hypothetical protein